MKFIINLNQLLQLIYGQCKHELPTPTNASQISIFRCLLYTLLYEQVINEIRSNCAS